MQVTKETIIGDILDMDRTTAPYFLEMGMHCLGCALASMENIEQACCAHGVDADDFVFAWKRLLLPETVNPAASS